MIQSVKVKNLSLSKDNVRKCKRAVSVESLAANIAAHGLLQNMIVTPLKKAGHYTVKAGGRRLRALQLLIDKGTLPETHEVQVLVLADDALSVEASLAENFHRVPMNPTDECAAFNHFIQKGTSAEDVAVRFGVTTRFVEQRVRLAELAPCVFAALAAGEITLGVAQAYAVTADVDRQAHVFAQMATSYYGDSPDNIKRALLNGATKAPDAKARYVGREAYINAGGRIDRDLFAAEGDESWIDSHIIEQLAEAKLQAAAADLATREGYAFVIPVISTRVPYDLERQFHEYHPRPRAATAEERAALEALAAESDTLAEKLESTFEHGTPEAEAANARLDAIEDEIERIDAARASVDPALKPQLGTFVLIGADGETRVHTRLFSQKPVVDPNAPVGTGVAGAGNADHGEGTAAPAVGPRLSAALVDELATQRRQILAAHLASDPALALDLTIFLMAQKIVHATAYLQDHSTLRAEAAAFPLSAFRDEGSQASAVIDEQREALDQSWAGYATMSERFAAFRQLDEDMRAAWIGFAIARTLEATLNVSDGPRVNGFHDHLGRLLGISVADWWRPTAENFFGRVRKDVMLAALEEIGGATLRARYKDAKKGELAGTCAALCAGQGIVEAEVRDKAIAWLPDAMRFDGVDQPNRHLNVGDQAEDDDDGSDIDLASEDGIDIDDAIGAESDVGDPGDADDLDHADLDEAA